MIFQVCLNVKIRVQNWLEDRGLRIHPDVAAVREVSDIFVPNGKTQKFKISMLEEVDPLSFKIAGGGEVEIKCIEPVAAEGDTTIQNLKKLEIGPANMEVTERAGGISSNDCPAGKYYWPRSVAN
jgi:hypothetical protein